MTTTMPVETQAIIDFTCTETCRPDVIARSAASFRENLLGVDWELAIRYANIDPVPRGREFHDAERAIRRLVGPGVTKYPDEANFAAALKFVWSMPVKRYFMHLELDWLLVKPVDVRDMIAIMENDPGLTSLTLCAHAHWTAQDRRILLAPGLFRTDHAKVLADRLSVTANPEKQLRPRSKRNPEGGKHHGFRGKVYRPGEVLIRDIGREWMEQNGLRKRGNDHEFITWERAT